MKTKQISFEVAEGILHSLNQSPAEFTAQARLLTAVQLFQSQKLSFGQAAELAGISQDRFLVELDSLNIPVINYSTAELDEELARFQQ
jgi:predicted HTH domain antitoxin